MSGYEVDHGLSRGETDDRPRRRPDLSTFWSNVRQMDDRENNTNTTPHPSQLSATYRMLANMLQAHQGETQGFFSEDTAATMAPANPGLLEYMIEQAMSGANEPPDRPAGVPEDFFDKLDRVSKAELQKRVQQGKNDTCPICSVPFLEDQYPLVVQLPCNAEHLFDLECIQPWLKLKNTCPLDRIELVKVESEQERLERILGKDKRNNTQDDEEEFDDMYG